MLGIGRGPAPGGPGGPGGQPMGQPGAQQRGQPVLPANKQVL